jgi:hypothetical protein
MKVFVTERTVPTRDWLSVAHSVHAPLPGASDFGPVYWQLSADGLARRRKQRSRSRARPSYDCLDAEAAQIDLGPAKPPPV